MMKITLEQPNLEMTKKSRTTLLDLYDPQNYNVSYANYKEIFRLLFEKITKALIEDGMCLELPARLGTLAVRKRQTKNNKVLDFQATKEYGVPIFHYNRHSGGYYAFLHWDKNQPVASFANKRIYELKLVRRQKRRIAKCIKENNSIIKYLEIE